MIAAARQGDEHAFRLIYEKYHDDLFQLAYRRTRSKDDSKDILQDLFISFWNNIDSIEVTDNIAAYFYVALRHRIFNYYEKQSVRLHHILQQPLDPVPSEDLILAGIRAKEIQACVSAAVQAMPEKMKEIYRLAKEQQLTMQEIAALLQLSPQTVKNQLHLAMERIRSQLRRNDLARFIFLV